MQIYLKIKASYGDSHLIARPTIERLVFWLQEIGYKSNAGYHTDILYVQYDSNFDGDKEIFISNLDKSLLAITFRNAGDSVIIIGEQETPKESVRVILAPSWIQLENFSKIDLDLLEELREIRGYFSISDTRARIIYGCSLIDKKYDADNRPKERPCPTCNKGRLISRPEYLQKKMGEDKLTIKKSDLCKLYKIRGDLAHKRSKPPTQENISYAVAFLDRYFHCYLFNKHKFIYPELRQLL